jgi:hypothetical protein
MSRFFLSDDLVALRGLETNEMIGEDSGLNDLDERHATEDEKWYAALFADTIRLDAAADRAANVVAQAEWFLSRYLGVEVSARVGFSDNLYLAFAPLDDEYKFHIIEERMIVDDYYPEPTLREFTIRWESCSQEMRLKAFAKLPALVERITRERDQLISTAEAAAGRVEKLVGRTHGGLPVFG